MSLDFSRWFLCYHYFEKSIVRDATVRFEGDYKFWNLSQLEEIADCELFLGSELERKISPNQLVNKLNF